MRVAIFTINQPSFDSALRLVKSMEDFDAAVFAKEGFSSGESEIIHYKKLSDALRSAWGSFDAIIAILATGAVVRLVAPLLQNKTKDPAVLVINLALDKIIPLLGGHLGGANELSNLLAKRLGAVEFLSTATDQTKSIAFDMVAKKNGWRIENISKLARVSNSLLNGKKVKVATTQRIFQTLTSNNQLELISLDEVDENSVVIYPCRDFSALTLRPKVAVGIGSNRGTKKEEFEEVFDKFLAKNSLSLESVSGFFSFEAKSSEAGLLEFVESLNLPIEFFSKERINALNEEFSDSASSKFFGLKGVAEPSALLGSKYRDLIIKKEAFLGKITLAGAI